MVVMIFERVSPGLRGELTRWLVEPHTGIFVGHLSAMVREKLWEQSCKKVKEGGAWMIWSTNNEQRFSMRSFGATKRHLVDYEGLLLVQRDLSET